MHWTLHFVIYSANWLKIDIRHEKFLIHNFNDDDQKEEKELEEHLSRNRNFLEQIFDEKMMIAWTKRHSTV